MPRLIDADALRRAICGDKCGCEPDECGRDTDPAMCEMVAYVENAPTVSKWINVKDRLPDEDGSTLICTKNGKVCTARFYKRQGWWNAYAGRNAEYWMPLPKPPKEDDA